MKIDEIPIFFRIFCLFLFINISAFFIGTLDNGLDAGLFILFTTVIGAAAMFATGFFQKYLSVK